MQIDSPIKRLISISNGRSGSKWVADWLMQHPRCFGRLEESYLFQRLMYFSSPDWPGRSGGGATLHPWVNEDYLNQYLRSFADNFLTCPVEHRIKYDGQPYVIEKSSANHMAIDFIRKLYPSSYFIIMYKDGKNWVESLLYHKSKAVQDRHHHAPTIENMIEMWQRTMSVIENAKNDDHVLGVRYEDLLKSPVQCRDITAFLGIEHHKDITAWSDNASFNWDRQYDFDRWKTLPKDVLNKMEAMNGALISNGYEPV